MPTKIITKNGSGTPPSTTLARGELGLDLTNNKLYSSTNGTDIVEITPTMPEGVKAWVRFDGTGATSIKASYNVTSLSDFGVGNIDANFTTPVGNNPAVTIGGNVIHGYTSASASSGASIQTFNNSLVATDFNDIHLIVCGVG